MTISTPDGTRGGGNLPRAVDAFVGREVVVRHAGDRLASVPVLTLTGPGGVGKTRLALTLARTAREHGAYRDGVWQIRLDKLTAPADVQKVAREIAHELGVAAQDTAPPLEVLAGTLSSAHLLLVVDNCEHVITSAAAVVGELVERVPGLTVIATSRRALGVRGEHAVALSPLSTPGPGELSSVEAASEWEAVRLFVDRAQAAVPTFRLGPDNVALVGDLCAALDGLPLAVEMAARKLRMTSLHQIIQRMQAPETNDRLVLLGGTDHAGPPRHRTLRALIDWSYELCSPKERLVWGRCAVFRGGFDAAAAQGVCAGESITPGEVFDLLDNLVDQSLLMLDAEDRYSQLTPLHDYSAGLLRESGEEALLRERHADYYRRLALQAERGWWGPDQLHWYARLHHERGNIRAAITHYLATPGGATSAMEILSALRCWWSSVFGAFSEAREYLDQALELDPQPHSQRATALWAGGYLALRQGDLEAADALLAESCAVAQKTKDLPSLTCAMHLQGLTAFFRGDAAGAVTLLEQALGRCRELGDEPGVWMARCHLAMATAAAGDFDAAQEYGRQCLETANARTALLSRSGALWALGWGRWLARDIPAAEKLLSEGLTLMREHGDLWGIAECQEVLAWIAAAAGTRDQYAARLLGSAQAAWQTVGAYVRLRPLAIQHDACVTRLRARLGAEAFAEAIQAGARGELRVLPAPPQQPPPVNGPLATLTPREWEVTVLIAGSFTNKEIAAKLVIAEDTVKTHVANILAKLNAANRREIAKAYNHAIQNGGQAAGLTAPERLTTPPAPEALGAHAA